MKEFYLLQQEGFLSRSCICIGLNCLSKANVGEKGDFYSSFFSLSIGIERIAKTCVILNHLLENNFAYPDEKFLRGLGHDLKGLYDHLLGIANLKFPGLISPIATTSIEHEILEFLSDFARKSRYYNLSTLSGNTSLQNPLASWYKILENCFELDSHSGEQKRVGKMISIGAEIESRATIVSSGMGENSISVPERFGQGALIFHSRGHIQFRVITLINFFKDVLLKLNVQCHQASSNGMNGPPIPFFEEFFEFLGLPKRDLKRKRRWP